MELPPLGEYGTGILFLKEETHEQAKEAFNDLARGCDLKVIAWRKLRTNSDEIGEEARKTEPCIRQVISRFRFNTEFLYLIKQRWLLSRN